MGEGFVKSLVALKGLGFCSPPPVTLITDAGFLSEKQAHSEGNAGKHEGKSQECLLVKDVGESGKAVEQLVNERHSLHTGSFYFRHFVAIWIKGPSSTQRCSHAFASFSHYLAECQKSQRNLHLDLDTLAFFFRLLNSVCKQSYLHIRMSMILNTDII